MTRGSRKENFQFYMWDIKKLWVVSFHREADDEIENDLIRGKLNKSKISI